MEVLATTRESPLIIRVARAIDAPMAHAIDVEAFGPYGTAEKLDTLAARQQVFPDGFLIAEVTGEIVGYASSEKWLTERAPALDEPPSQTHSPNGSIFCITAMAVRRARQNHGIGTALLTALLDVAQAHQCKAVLLETTHAQHFYLHHGFQITQVRRERDVELSVMKKNLPYPDQP